MPERKSIMIYDIARRLKISPATVSRMLNGHPYISPTTKDKVSELAGMLGYPSNYYARCLQGKSSKTIGIIVHEMDSYFITSALKEIGRVAFESGYGTFISHSQECMKKEVENAQLLFDRKVDGVIASLSVETKNLRHFEVFAGKNIPIVLFDRVEEMADSDTVVIDNYKCGYTAAAHLIEQGCKRIAIVTSSIERNVYAQRYKGFCDALTYYGIPFTGELLLLGGIQKDAGLDAACRIVQMKTPPDGLFITNDLVAAMCMNALKERGVGIPDDIAIVGFNNDPIGRLTTPALTTIDYPGEEMGRVAMEKLLMRLSGKSPNAQPQTTVVNSGLVVRASSLKARYPVAS